VAASSTTRRCPTAFSSSRASVISRSLVRRIGGRRSPLNVVAQGITSNAWVDHLEGNAPDYPVRALSASLADVQRRVRMAIEDPTTET
jgi:hypothetical protein